uniref:Uncharacterized protein n=1 Tax=Anguilla anguilla TaxID=7936 RepID=A0A0E9TUV3_ANGAN
MFQLSKQQTGWDKSKDGSFFYRTMKD